MADATKCYRCGETPRTRCLAEDHGDIIGREGTHLGYCWGGRFPTAQQAEEWWSRLEHPPERPPDEVRLAPEQLEFNL